MTAPRLNACAFGHIFTQRYNRQSESSRHFERIFEPQSVKTGTFRQSVKQSKIGLSNL